MNMSRIILTCLLGIFMVTPMQSGEGTAHEQSSFRVVGYLPDYREFERITTRGLTDLILFSATPTATGDLDISRLKKMPWSKLRAFKTKQRVRLILCVGGWERSSHFAAVAGSDPIRQKFVNAMVKFCLDERLDGIDLDWEHPKNGAEQAAYANLLTELHKAFEQHGLMLSVTIAAWQKLPSSAFEAVDWVNLMAYDHTGQHSTFESAQSDVKKLIDSGMPARKITLGLPFYGRDIKNSNRVLTYREIVANNRPEPAVDEIDNIYFNGPETISRKTKYAIDKGLAGVMVWELGQDAAGDQSLLKVIMSAVDQLAHK
jgi:GH18 family chitinase